MDYLTEIVRNSRGLDVEGIDELVPFVGYTMFTTNYNIKQPSYSQLKPFFSCISYFSNNVGSHPSDVLDDVIGKVWEYAVSIDSLGLKTYSLGNTMMDAYYSTFHHVSFPMPYALFTLRYMYTSYERGSYVTKSSPFGQVRVNEIYPEDSWLPKG